MKSVFMFPGQGSQSIGMMASLLEEHAIAREVFEQASSAIGYDLVDIAARGPEELINSTAITQPIVLTASIAMWRVWCANNELRPDFMCGHSLGEYSALVASGVLAFDDAVKLVHLRGKLMQDAVPHGQGAMAALLGLEDDKVIAVCEQAAQGDVVSAANFNAPGQVVISGSMAALERALVMAKEAGARRAAMLPVSVPCHCALLAPAGQALADAVAKLEFNEPSIPIMQNFTALIPDDIEELKSSLLSHLHQPVLWAQSIKNLAALDVELFVECGPGKVLSGLNKRIVRDATTVNMSDTQTMSAVMEAFSA